MKRILYVFLLAFGSFALWAQQPGELDLTFNPGAGISSGWINTIVLQPDNKVLIGGNFTSYDGTARNHIVRLNADGSLDLNFSPVSGPNNWVSSIALQTDGKVLIGGEFASYDGSQRKGIARINADGSLDASFNPGTGFPFPINSSTNIRTIALQPDGKMLVGGGFTSFNGTARNHIARLNADGSLDMSFNPGSGADDFVSSIAVQSDGKILIVGEFTAYNGVACNGIARLNSDGSIDATFDEGGGFYPLTVLPKSVKLQADGKVLVVGDFTSFNGTARNRIARLNADGSLDMSFNPGSGANDMISSIAVQPDGKMLIVGSFTSFNGTSCNRIARLNADGSLDISFNPGSGANNWISCIALQPDEKVLIAGTFTNYNGTARNQTARVHGGALNCITQDVFLSDTVSVCGSSYTLDAGAGYSSYAWSTGATSSSITVSASGTYSCTVTDNNACSSTDQVYVALQNLFDLSATQSSICLGDSVQLSVSTAGNAGAITQLGLDIDGEAAGDKSGYSVSMPDAFTVAIGANLNDGNDTNSGHVRIYSWNGTSWVQKGGDIDGEAAGDESGYSVSMPDAHTVAIGAFYNDGNGSKSGHVRIYSWNGTSWVQKGVDIDGEALYDRSGWSVSMPDANTVAIGAPYNDGNGTDAGHVRIYSWNGTSWVQKGGDIDGEAAGDQSGRSVSMPDANTVAIGAWQNDGNGAGSGHVRIYSWNGTSWVQKGVDIDGEAAYDYSGWSVSMPDANTVAIGGTSNEGNGSGSGHVRVYGWNGASWVQKGVDIDGEAAGDGSGYSVSMPDANTVAIGARGNDGNGVLSGHVRIYSWNGTSWVQKGVDMDGEAAYDYSGNSVSMPDANTVAIGAPLNNGNGSDAGHVRIYSLPASGPAITYLWSTGDTTATITVAPTQTTTYTCTVNDGTNSCTDSLTVVVSTPPAFNLGADTITVCGSSYTLDAGAGYSSYAWSTGATSSSITVSASGTYSCTVTDNNACSSTDQVYVALLDFANITATQSSICLGDSVQLSVSTAGNAAATTATITQLGLDIDGEAADDRSGYSVSMPDANTVAIGAPYNDGNDTNSGHVRIYSWNGTSWVQKGVDIDGEAADDYSGYSVSMPDANTVAIGANGNDGNRWEVGHVRIYSWNGTSWVQKGGDIDGEAVYDESGWSVSMPDANTVAIGARFNNGNGSDAGHVRIYSWNGTSWVKKGGDIDGEAADDQSGYSVSMPDANTVAIGAVGNDGNGSYAGHVRIYSWNGTSWVQKGGDIDGEASGDESGKSVSMPDANTVAIGAPFNDGNGGNAGHVRIYSWSGTSWVQKGGDIDGEAVYDISGFSVSMPDANTVAIGATANDGNGSSSGHVRIYSWNGTSWVQNGGDIDGEAAYDISGYSVSMPDANTVAIGAIHNDGNGTHAGHTRVYSIPAPASNTGSYLWSTGDTTATITVAPTQTTTYTCTVNDGTNSCTDSLRVVVNTPPAFNLGADTVSVCGSSYTLDAGAGLGSYLWSTGDTASAIAVTASGMYSLTVTNGGCSVSDSVYVHLIHLQLAVGEPQFQWAQEGAAIVGTNSGDRSGSSVACAADGMRFAVGAINGGNGQGEGEVRVFEWNNGLWQLMGNPITGEDPFDGAGQSVALSANGSRLAIGASANSGSGPYAGHVRVFQYNGSNWVQLGNDIDGEAPNDGSGQSVALSADGNLVAIGASSNSDNGLFAGHVRIYQWTGSAWSQLGGDIDGEAAFDGSGQSVALSSNGYRVAIGATGNNNFTGHVRTYDWNGTSWVQLGADIDGEAMNDGFGQSVSLSSDGNRLAVGAPGNNGNGSFSGHARVYEFDGSNWVQLGSDLDGESSYDGSGQSVSLSGDGQTVAIGASANSGYAGHTRLYQWEDNTWMQIGSDIDGEAMNDESGWSVALSANGQSVVIGATGASGTAQGDSIVRQSAGHVRVFTLSSSYLDSNSTVSACGADTLEIVAILGSGNMGDLSYLWSTGDTTASIAVTPAQTTTYTCTVSDGSNSCTESITIQAGGSIPQANVVGNYRVNISWNNTGASLYEVWYRLIGESTWNNVNANSSARSLFPLAPGDYEYYVSEAGGANPSCTESFTVICEDFGYSTNVFQVSDATQGKINVFGVNGGRRTWDFGLFNGIDTLWVDNRFSNRFIQLAPGAYLTMVKDHFDCFSSQLDFIMIDAVDSNVIPVLTAVQNLGSGSLRPEWTVSDTSRIDRYLIRVKDMTGGGLGTLYQTYIALGASASSYTINGLPPARYRLDVKGKVDGSFANGIYSNYIERVVTSNKGESIAAINGQDGKLIQLYPNPTEELLYVRAPMGSELILIDMNGKRIAQRSVSTPEEVFNMRELAQGVYLLQVIDQQEVFQERIVKQ